METTELAGSSEAGGNPWSIAGWGRWLVGRRSRVSKDKLISKWSQYTMSQEVSVYYQCKQWSSTYWRELWRRAGLWQGMRRSYCAGFPKACVGGQLARSFGIDVRQNGLLGAACEIIWQLGIGRLEAWGDFCFVCLFPQYKFIVLI